tara:strand:+ start:1213 stop:1395 length:183 start_codon:yes stop_codon:yes gene_type:complete
MHKFFKGILILIACLIIAALSALFFKFFGDYAFLIMIVITLLALMQRVKPKFGNKDKEEE